MRKENSGRIGMHSPLPIEHSLKKMPFMTRKTAPEKLRATVEKLEHWVCGKT
jgi:hypothetical protein